MAGQACCEGGGFGGGTCQDGLDCDDDVCIEDEDDDTDDGTDDGTDTDDDTATDGA